MSTYNIDIRHIINYYGRDEVESWFKDYELSDYLTSKQIQVITNAGLWNKDKLAKKIVDHYFMREIGFETPALFKHFAQITMKEIMEQKLPFIYTNSIEYDPLINVDFTETFSRTANNEGTNAGTSISNETGTNESSNIGTSESSSTNSGSGLNVSSDTPQGQINKQNILNGDYASSTSANESENSINDNTETSSTTTVNSTLKNNTTNNINTTNTTNEEYTKHYKGNQGISATYQAMIKQFRENIIAIDKEIIEDLNSLFMGLY